MCHDSAERSAERNHRRWIAGLATFHFRDFGTDRDALSGERAKRDDSSFNATAHGGDIAGLCLNASQGKNTFLEISFLDRDGFDAKILDAGGIKHHRIGNARGICRRKTHGERE
jgi:hypothetical protein